MCPDCEQEVAAWYFIHEAFDLYPEMEISKKLAIAVDNYMTWLRQHENITGHN